MWLLVRWSIVVATMLGMFWVSVIFVFFLYPTGHVVRLADRGAHWQVIVAGYRHQVWITLRNDGPTWSFWNFTLFVATASSMRLL